MCVRFSSVEVFLFLHSSAPQGLYSLISAPARREACSAPGASNSRTQRHAGSHALRHGRKRSRVLSLPCSRTQTHYHVLKQCGARRNVYSLAAKAWCRMLLTSSGCGIVQGALYEKKKSFLWR